ncbi:MAG: serine/threonine-protein kinase [Vicinamibacterales bacterium]
MAPSSPIERIGRYQVLERVGKGGMGVLYRGFDPVLDREVAIKLMLADFTEDAEQMRPRFYREARAAAKLNHRNIVTIFEFAEESNVPYIVMEFLRGTSLGARMSGSPRLSLDDKLSIVGQLCDGLSYAHEQGVVHRDVKPDNVFVLEDGTVKLLDFGIAKLTASNLTLQGDVLGSASYMSPEQVSQSESVDGRADVFSAGVVLYELLTGHKPFQAETPTAVILKILRDPPTPIGTYVSGLPPALCSLVNTALSKDPADRFATADRMSKELQGIRRALATQTTAPNLDETGFADTRLLQGVSEEVMRLREASNDVASTAKEVGAAAGAALGAVTPRPMHARKQTPPWLVPAAIAGVLLLSATAYLTLSARQVSQPPSANAVTVNADKTAASTSAPRPTDAGTAPPPAAPAATPEKPAATPTRPATPAPPLVSVSLTGEYPFEVYDGRKMIFSANTTHKLKWPAGKSLVMVNDDVFLRQTVRVDGTATDAFTWSAPVVGRLAVRSSQELCDVMIGDRKIGNPPVTNREIVPGQYKIDIRCAGDIVKTGYATVRAGLSEVATIR